MKFFSSLTHFFTPKSNSMTINSQQQAIALFKEKIKDIRRQINEIRNVKSFESKVEQFIAQTHKHYFKNEPELNFLIAVQKSLRESQPINLNNIANRYLNQSLSNYQSDNSNKKNTLLRKDVIKIISQLQKVTSTEKNPEKENSDGESSSEENTAEARSTDQKNLVLSERGKTQIINNIKLILDKDITINNWDDDILVEIYVKSTNKDGTTTESFSTTKSMFHQRLLHKHNFLVEMLVYLQESATVPDKLSFSQKVESLKATYPECYSALLKSEVKGLITTVESLLYEKEISKEKKENELFTL